MKKNEYKLEKFETKTGVLLNVNGERYVGQGDAFILFNAINEAKQYVKNNIIPGVMYIVSDSEDNVVYEYIYEEVIKEVYVHKKWWKWW